MMKKIIQILLGCLTFGGLISQSDYRPGYIVNNSFDTLIGEIDYRDDMVMRFNCKFKDVANQVINYSPDDLKSFKFDEGKLYASKFIEGQQIFLEYLVKGKLDVLYSKDELGDHYFIKKDSFELIELPFEEDTRFVDGTKYFHKTTKHIGILKYYLKDAPEFSANIESVEKPKHKNMIKLAQDYHNLVCENEECVVYNKGTSFRLHPEFSVGVVNYPKIEVDKNKLTYNANVFLHFWLPRASEKLYFRTGLQFTEVNFKNQLIRYFKVPFHFEYIYPSGRLRPRFAYGFNYYVPRFHTVSLNLGVNLKISEEACLSILSDIEFEPNAIVIPKTFLGYGAQFGIFISINK